MASPLRLSPALLRPSPLPGEVHLWCLKPPSPSSSPSSSHSSPSASPSAFTDPSLLASYWSMLSQQERLRIASSPPHQQRADSTLPPPCQLADAYWLSGGDPFVSLPWPLSPAQLQQLLTRALVRATLARYMEGRIHPADIPFRTNPWGKPQVCWASLHNPSAPIPPIHAWQQQEHYDNCLISRVSHRHEPGGRARDGWAGDANGTSSSTTSISSRGSSSGGGTALHFNVTHTHSLIALAVTSALPVGVDVESSSRCPRRGVLPVARRRFAAEEAAWVGAGRDERERQRRFVHLWTLKEAYVKARGLGMNALPFRSFSFHLSPSHQAALALKDSLAHVADKPWSICLSHSPSSPPTLNQQASSSSPLTNSSEATSASPPPSPLTPYPSAHASTQDPLDCDADVAPRESDMWRSMLVQLSPAHVVALCTGCHDLPRHYPLSLHAWYTVPLLGDEPARNILGLGVSI
ncbi:hypothetical protein CLOP_g25058 [Closterium sp. NIES-67]|nr:hypothetical protein CLOP_g25058 [Closterium sp. NIES-67]